LLYACLLAPQLPLFRTSTSYLRAKQTGSCYVYLLLHTESVRQTRGGALPTGRELALCFLLILVDPKLWSASKRKVQSHRQGLFLPGSVLPQLLCCKAPSLTPTYRASLPIPKARLFVHQQYSKTLALRPLPLPLSDGGRRGPGAARLGLARLESSSSDYNSVEVDELWATVSISNRSDPPGRQSGLNFFNASKTPKAILYQYYPQVVPLLHNPRQTDGDVLSSLSQYTLS